MNMNIQQRSFLFRFNQQSPSPFWFDKRTHECDFYYVCNALFIPFANVFAIKILFNEKMFPLLLQERCSLANGSKVYRIFSWSLYTLLPAMQIESETIYERFFYLVVLFCLVTIFILAHVRAQLDVSLWSFFSVFGCCLSLKFATWNGGVWFRECFPSIFFFVYSFRIPILVRIVRLGYFCLRASLKFGYERKFVCSFLPMFLVSRCLPGFCFEYRIWRIFYLYKPRIQFRTELFFSFWRESFFSLIFPPSNPGVREFLLVSLSCPVWRCFIYENPSWIISLGEIVARIWSCRMVF